MSSEQRSNRIKQLETLLLKEAPPNKKESWKRELEHLKNPKNKKNKARKRKPIKSAQNRDQAGNSSFTPSVNLSRRRVGMQVAKNIGNSMSMASSSKPLERTLELNIAKTISVMLDPDSGPVRLCDDTSSPTAIYKSVQEFTIVADGSKDNGRFTAIIQPTLGSNQTPRAYKNALAIIPASSSGIPNFAKSSSFESFVNNIDVRVDPNLTALIQPIISQQTWTGTFPVSNTEALIYQYVGTSVGSSGNNNSNFIHYPATIFSSALGFTPTRPIFKIPPGVYLSSLTLAFNNDAYITGGNWMSTTNYHKINNVVQQTRFSLRIYKISSNATAQPPMTEALDELVLGQIGSTSSTGTVYGLTSGARNSGAFLKYAMGTMGMPTGSGSSAGTDIGSLGSMTNFMVIPYAQDAAYYAEIVMENVPQMTTLNGSFLQFGWVISSTILSDEPIGFDQRSLVQRLRPTAMKCHLMFESPLLTTGGQVASAVLPGSMQSSIFSPSGYGATSYDQLCTYNRKERLYTGALTKSTYAVYAPESIPDWQLKTYPESLAYDYPFIVITGNATFTSGTVGPQVIGRLRVVTCFEYTTVSTVVDTQACLGADQYYSACLQAMSLSGLCHENPAHKKWFQDILKTAGSVVSTLTKVMPSIANVIETVGMAIV